MPNSNVLEVQEKPPCVSAAAAPLPCAESIARKVTASLAGQELQADLTEVLLKQRSEIMACIDAKIPHMLESVVNDRVHGKPSEVSAESRIYSVAGVSDTGGGFVAVENNGSCDASVHSTSRPERDPFSMFSSKRAGSTDMLFASQSEGACGTVSSKARLTAVEVASAADAVTSEKVHAAIEHVFSKGHDDIRKKRRRVTDYNYKSSVTDFEETADYWKSLVRDPRYEFSVIFVVFCNAAFLGWQAQYHASWSTRHNNDTSVDLGQWKEYWFNKVCEHVFMVFFVVELCFHVACEGRTFISKSGWKWNLFDVFVTAVVVLETVLQWADLLTSGLSAWLSFRMLRILRVVRVVRIIRVLKFFRDLRLMVASVLHSLVSLVWALVVLVVMFYIFGLCLSFGVMDFLDERRGWTNPAYGGLVEDFGSLGACMLSLLAAMSGGRSWGEYLDALQPMSAMYAIVFLAFIAVSVFAVLNILTGVFVQSALDDAQHDRECMISDAMAKREIHIVEMREVFQEIDSNSSGTISMQELSAAIDDPRLGAYLEALGLSVDDTNMLFRLLDRDRQGFIEIEAFLEGCLRLKGEARAWDMAVLLYQSQWMMHNTEQLLKQVRENHDVMHEVACSTVSNLEGLSTSMTTRPEHSARKVAPIPIVWRQHHPGEDGFFNPSGSGAVAAGSSKSRWSVSDSSSLELVGTHHHPGVHHFRPMTTLREASEPAATPIAATAHQQAARTAAAADSGRHSEEIVPLAAAAAQDLGPGPGAAAGPPPQQPPQAASWRLRQPQPIAVNCSAARALPEVQAPLSPKSPYFAAEEGVAS